MVDADPQGDLTTALGWTTADSLPITLETQMKKILQDEPFVYNEGILHHKEGVDIIPTNIELSGMEISLVNAMSREQTLKLLSAIFADMKVEKLFISAKKRENITILEKKLVQAAALPEVNQNDIIITNVRHYEALTRALDSIHRVQEGLQLELSGDLVSEDLRQCIHELSEIVAEGGITSEETLQNIFQNFCIGK